MFESNVQLKVKLGRNDKCFCGSEKKYKLCCYEKDASKYLLGQSVSSPLVEQIKTIFREKHPNHIFIDISDDLTSNDKYVEYQKHNIASNIVMIAQRAPHSEAVFEKRIRDPEADIIIMYRGAYRTFCGSRVDYFAKSISVMIDG